MNALRVYLRSAPGPWERYEGYVDVTVGPAEPQDDYEPEPLNILAFRAAVRQLSRTSFPDRPNLSSWIVQRIELQP